MTIETDLKSLITRFSRSHLDELNERKRLVLLQEALNQLLYKHLLLDGPDKLNIGKNYNKLVPYFDAKSDIPLSDEVQWLDKTLATEGKRSICFETLTLHYQQLTEPEKFKKIEFADISTWADLRRWLINMRDAKNPKPTAGGVRLYNSLLSLLDQASGYLDEVGTIRPAGVSMLLSSLPAVLVSVGTIVFIEELLAIYALYFILLKSGEYIAKGRQHEMRAIGTGMQQFTIVTAATTTAILVRLVEMIFWGAHKSYSGSLTVGTTVLELTSGPSNVAEPEEITEQDVLSISTHCPRALDIKDPKLRVVAAILEARKGQLSQQYGLRFRLGANKFVAIDDFLKEVRKLDKTSDPIEFKLARVQELIASLKADKVVYAKTTEKAIDTAERFLQFLIEHPFVSVERESETVTTEPDCSLDSFELGMHV